VTGAYDPDLNLIYWGTGNPGPDWNGDDRQGDNLYSNCLLAIDADTGKLRWHFQFTPHDVHDWDSNQVPVLFDGIIGGRGRKLVAQANRNAFYYVLDRETGEFLQGIAYAKQTWARGLDSRGRPIVLPDTDPTPEGNLVYPGLGGGTNWFSPSYSPQTKLFYVQAQEEYAQVYYKLKTPFSPGRQFEGGGARNVPGVEAYGTVKALEATTGKLKWEFKLHASSSAGLLSTGGGLVFGGSREGYFFALNAVSGEPLWHFQTGGSIGANPVSFMVGNKQYVGIAAGKALFAFALD
jgi:alcohol dehydrogenase (cytochrome c)